eukprot:2189-Heterococcus_DN1.PRE.1
MLFVQNSSDDKPGGFRYDAEDVSHCCEALSRYTVCYGFTAEITTHSSQPVSVYSPITIGTESQYLLLHAILSLHGTALLVYWQYDNPLRV